MIRIAIWYPAIASVPKLEMIRTRKIQLAVPISTWNVPVPESRNIVRITAGWGGGGARPGDTRGGPRPPPGKREKKTPPRRGPPGPPPRAPRPPPNEETTTHSPANHLIV